MNPMNLKGKTALVTGASRGIGRAIAIRLAEAGAAVACVARNEEKLKETVALCKETGAEAAYFICDIRETGTVRAVVSDVGELFGTIGILVNNAGTVRDNLMVRMTEEEWDEVLDTNLKGTFRFCKAVSRPMLKARSGRIINIVSSTGLAGNVGQSNYAASKAGMMAFTKSVARELATRGVTANCVAPGMIRTEMSDAIKEVHRERLLSMVPLQRVGNTQDVANAVLFLASDMAEYITGQVLNVDGGLVM